MPADQTTSPVRHNHLDGQTDADPDPVTPLHLGSLHAYEQALVLLLAFGPFLLLGLVVLLRRRESRPQKPGQRDR